MKEIKEKIKELLALNSIVANKYDIVDTQEDLLNDLKLMAIKNLH
jgi:hypothetical protein